MSHQKILSPEGKVFCRYIVNKSDDVSRIPSERSLFYLLQPYTERARTILAKELPLEEEYVSLKTDMLKAKSGTAEVVRSFVECTGSKY